MWTHLLPTLDTGGTGRYYEMVSRRNNTTIMVMMFVMIVLKQGCGLLPGKKDEIDRLS